MSSLATKTANWRLLLATLAFAAVVAGLSARASSRLVHSQHPDATNWVMQDFRDVAYYPSRAFLDGNNPYDTANYVEQYPVWHPLAMYTPLSLLMHAPFALLPFDAAWPLYFTYSLVLLVCLAALAVRVSELRYESAAAILVATLVLISRPGYMNTLLGQVGHETALAASVALYCNRTRPWTAATAMAISTFKPTYGLVLGILLLCRGDVRTVVRGGVLATIATGLATLPLLRAAGGIAPFIDSLRATFHAFGTEPFDDPTFGPFRIDTPALVAKAMHWHMVRSEEVLIGLVLLALSAWIVWRCRAAEVDDLRQRLSGTIISLVILAATYHQTYDLLLLVVPATALSVDRWLPRRVHSPLLWTLIVAAWLALALNYLASATMIDALQLSGWPRRVVTAINPGLVFGSIVLYVAVVQTRRQAPPQG